jgi:hypothetical protein
LDKWIKTEKEEKEKEGKNKKKTLKKETQSEIHVQESDTSLSHDKQFKKLVKYILVCTKKSCGYQKTLMKRQLSDKDKICPRCKGIMKIKTR